jgi:hypothetical protein
MLRKKLEFQNRVEKGSNKIQMLKKFIALEFQVILKKNYLKSINGKI